MIHSRANDRPIIYTSGFYRLQDDDFHIIANRGGTSHWHLGEFAVSSGLVGPYGGIWASNKFDLALHIKSITDVAIKFKKQEIIIRLPPRIFHPHLVNLHEQYFSEQNWKLECIETDHLVDLKSYSRNDLRKNRRREILKSSKYEEKVFIDNSLVKEFHDIITKNRARRGLENNLKSEIVNRLIKEGLANLWFTQWGNKLNACALVLEFNSEIVYVAQWGDVVLNRWSPISILADTIFGYYKNLKVRHMYLGTSSVNNYNDQGLCSFKESLTAVPKLKYTWKFKL